MKLLHVITNSHGHLQDMVNRHRTNTNRVPLVRQNTFGAVRSTPHEVPLQVHTQNTDTVKKFIKQDLKDLNQEDPDNELVESLFKRTQMHQLNNWVRLKQLGSIEAWKQGVVPVPIMDRALRTKTCSSNTPSHRLAVRTYCHYHQPHHHNSNNHAIAYP